MLNQTWMQWAEEHATEIANAVRGMELNAAVDKVAAMIPSDMEGSASASATLSIYRCIQKELLVLNPLGSYQGRNWIGSTLS